MLQDDRCRHRASAPEAAVIAVMQGSPCRVERLGQARQRRPVPRGQPRDANCPAAPQAPGPERDDGGGLAIEQREMSALGATEDTREGVRAFVEKREPQFVGR